MSTNTIALKIKFWPNKVLRKKSLPISHIGETEKNILEEMVHLMYANNGVGLSGPQVGINKQIIVVDVGQGPLMLANPKIIARRGASVFEEGCLSLPGLCIKIKRPERIKIQAINQDNQQVEIDADGLLSRALQHEIDHLCAKLIIDYASFGQKFKIRKQLQSLKKINNEGLSQQKTKSCKLYL